MAGYIARFLRRRRVCHFESVGCSFPRVSLAGFSVVLKTFASPVEDTTVSETFALPLDPVDVGLEGGGGADGDVGADDCRVVFALDKGFVMAEMRRRRAASMMDKCMPGGP